MKVSDDYFAGLFDGEGCVTARLDGKGCMTMSVCIQMCSREPVVALYERFGGFFFDGKRKTSKGSKIYEWRTWNADAVECLKVFSIRCLNKRSACIAGLKIAASMAANNRKQPLSMDEKLSRIECMEVIQKENTRGGKKTTAPKERIHKFLSEKNFGRKKVALSDGRVFESMTAAARELGVTTGAIWYGVNGGHPVKGLKVCNA